MGRYEAFFGPTQRDIRKAVARDGFAVLPRGTRVDVSATLPTQNERPGEATVWEANRVTLQEETQIRPATTPEGTVVYRLDSAARRHLAAGGAKTEELAEVDGLLATDLLDRMRRSAVDREGEYVPGRVNDLSINRVYFLLGPVDSPQPPRAA